MKKIFFSFIASILAFQNAVFSEAPDWNEKWETLSESDSEKNSNSILSKDTLEKSVKMKPFCFKLGETHFEIGSDVQSITAERIIQDFSINAYETSYQLWYEVRTKAKDFGYNFQNPGQEGSNGKRGRKPSSNPPGLSVTMISWYDAVVWCNALSELSGLTPCYTYNGQVLKDSSDTASLDLCQCNWQANGYRLPTEAEWEYASRWSKDGFNKGNTISGENQFKAEFKNDAWKKVAWTSDNTNQSMVIGTAGTIFTEDAPPEMGSGNSNEGGLFDMSGNMMEYCWDWFSEYTLQKSNVASGPEFGSKRVSRGGSWSPYTPFYFCADRYSFDPNEYYNYMGFRFVQSTRN